MLQLERIKRLSEKLVEENVDAIILGPSGDWKYLCGLEMHPDERFKAIVVLKDGSYFVISPMIYFVEFENYFPKETEYVIWEDNEGWHKKISKALKDKGLENKKIAINDGCRAIDVIDIMNFYDNSFINGEHFMTNLRIIKDAEELSYMKKAASIADEAFEETIKHIHSGMTEENIKDILVEQLFEKGGEKLSFTPIIASGPNSAMPHYSSYGRTIEDNDVIIMDFGCEYKGYCSDMSRTVFFGEPTDKMIEVWEICNASNLAGEEIGKVGIEMQEVDRAARKVIEDAGYGKYFNNRTGHGIGVSVHEEPQAKEGNITKLQNGMCYSVEPGIYIPGEFGMRTENIMACIDGKSEPLNRARRDMIIIK